MTSTSTTKSLQYIYVAWAMIITALLLPAALHLRHCQLPRTTAAVTLFTLQPLQPQLRLLLASLKSDVSDVSSVINPKACVMEFL